MAVCQIRSLILNESNSLMKKFPANTAATRSVAQDISFPWATKS